MSRLAEGERANAELLAYLILGAAARKGGDSLLRPKVHFFLRGLDEMVVALDGQPRTPVKADLFLSLHDAKEQFGGRHDDALLPGADLPSCGQHFFENGPPTWSSHGERTTSFGASRTATPPRTTTAGQRLVVPHAGRRPAPGWC